MGLQNDRRRAHAQDPSRHDSVIAAAIPEITQVELEPSPLRKRNRRVDSDVLRE